MAQINPVTPVHAILSTTSLGWHQESDTEWAAAVRAAAANLNAGWVLTDTKCAPTGLEEELAAFCCAYGL